MADLTPESPLWQPALVHWHRPGSPRRGYVTRLTLSPVAPFQAWAASVCNRTARTRESNYSTNTKLLIKIIISHTFVSFSRDFLVPVLLNKLYAYAEFPACGVSCAASVEQSLAEQSSEAFLSLHVLSRSLESVLIFFSCWR